MKKVARKMNNLLKCLTFLGLCGIITGCASVWERTTEPYAPDAGCANEPPTRVQQIHADILRANPHLSPARLYVCDNTPNIRQAYANHVSTGDDVIVLYTGLYNLSDSGLAAVIGHEYGHHIGRHVLDFVWRPTSPTPYWMQTEADDIGMALAARAGYDACALAELTEIGYDRVKRVIQTCSVYSATTPEPRKPLKKRHL